MKVRIRDLRKNICKSLTITTGTLDELLSSLEAELGCSRSDIQLSLNYGKSFLDIGLDNDTQLSSLGVVSGDLITVKLPETNHLAASSVASNQSSASTNNPSHPANVPCERSQSTAIASGSNQPERCHSGNTPVPSNDTPHSEMDAQTLDDETRKEINKYLSEPILLRESSSDQIPHSFQMLLSENQSQTPGDTMFLTLHTLMTESGFNTTLPAKEILSSSRSTASSYKLQYTWYGMPAGHLVCVVIGHNIIAHGLVSGSTSHHLSLNMMSYISDSLCQLRNLRRLSTVFKDRFVVPFLLNVQAACGINGLPPLLGLPLEVMIRLFSMCDMRSVLALGSTCTQLAAIYQDPSIWRKLYLNRFGVRREDNSLSIDWFHLYSEQHKLRSAMKRTWRQFEVTSEQQRRLPPPGVFPALIGGNYDLDPLTEYRLPNEFDEDPFRRLSHASNLLGGAGAGGLPGREFLPLRRPPIGQRRFARQPFRY